MKKRVFLVLCTLLPLMLYASPDRVRMITIGLDYANSGDSDMVLYGTINDALEMTAAVKNVMEAKGVEFESVMMLQEGEGDIYAEITVTSEDRLEELVTEAESVLIRLNPDSTDGTVYSLDGRTTLIRDRMDEETFIRLSEELTALDGGKGEIELAAFDIKDTPTYPSADNIINEVLLSSDLDYDDLLIVYYSGHGGSDNAFTMLSAESVFQPFVDKGRITEGEMKRLLDLDVIIEDTVMDALTSLGVDDETVYDIAESMEESDDYYKTGVLATAYTWENHWGCCSSLEMYMLYTALSFLKCDCVLIIDACYSGFAADDLSQYIDETEYDHAVNIEVMSASSSDETSEEVAIELDDGEYESHGAFTLEVLSALGWEHGGEKTTTIEVPFYTILSDGSVTDITDEREVNGWTAFIPERQTASDFFYSVIEDWDASDQHPQDGESTYLLYFIP